MGIPYLHDKFIRAKTNGTQQRVFKRYDIGKMVNIRKNREFEAKWSKKQVDILLLILILTKVVLGNPIRPFT